MSTKNMKKKGLPEDFVFDLDGLKYFPGVLQVVHAGFFAGNRTESSTYKQLERDTFPITVLPRGQDGLCCLKVHVEKFLRDGIQQPQEFLLSRKKIMRHQEKK